MTENEVPIRIGKSALLMSDKLTQEEYNLLPNADYIMNNTFWVGTCPILSNKETDKISKLIHEFIKNKTK